MGSEQKDLLLKCQLAKRCRSYVGMGGFGKKMTEKLFIFLIYSSGIIKHGENGVYYEGPPLSMLPLSQGVTFEDLCDGVAFTLHINRADSKLIIWYRFHFQCHPHPVTYQQVLVGDDNGVNAIFDMLDCQYGFVGAELYVGVEPIRSHRDVFPIRYANEGLSASFSYSHSGHFHNPYATHTGHYSQDAAHSPINIGGVDYHASYTHVAIEDQHVPYQPINTSDADHDNPTEHVKQETTCLSLKLSMTKPPLRELLMIPMIHIA